MADWDENSPELIANLQAVLRTIAQLARERRAPSAQDAKAWHARVMQGLIADEPIYIGKFRGEPGLEETGVRIGGNQGTPPWDVEAELAAFTQRLTRTIAYLDSQIPPGQVPDAGETRAVLEICGWVHAEWIRIHPFANGNGRTARLWVNYVAFRYSLPPFLPARPRPAEGYDQAGERAMRGDWQPTVEVLKKFFERYRPPDGS